MSDPMPSSSGSSEPGSGRKLHEELPLPMEVVSADRLVAAGLVQESVDQARRSAQKDGRMPHGALLVMAEVVPGKMDALRALLDEIVEKDVETNPIVPFLRLRTVHFARFLIHEAAVDADGNPIPAKLLFGTDYDGTLDEHLAELVVRVGPGLHRIFSHCRDYNITALNPDKLAGYLRGHMMRANTMYIGTVRRSVQQIRREAKLYEAIEDFIDVERRKPDWPAKDPLAIRNRIRQFVFANEAFSWAKVEPGEFPRNFIIGKRHNILAGIALIPFLPILVIGVLVLRSKERSDPSSVRVDIKEHASRLARREDLVVQNQMSTVVNIKPGWFRGTILRAVLAALNLAVPKVNVEGRLAGIPSIHFARWVIIDEGRRLTFFSNFDGSWENYLGDFIDRAATGLTAVWSNCVGFPRTRFLVLEGARDEQRFKAYSRGCQVPTQVWYSAYKRLSVENINNNTKIRAGLHGDMTAQQAQEWLRLF